MAAMEDRKDAILGYIRNRYILLQPPVQTDPCRSVELMYHAVMSSGQSNRSCSLFMGASDTMADSYDQITVGDSPKTHRDMVSAGTKTPVDALTLAASEDMGPASTNQHCAY